MRRRLKGSIGIAAVLAIVFGGLVAASTGALLFLSLDNALEATRNTLATKLENLLNDAVQKSRAVFDPMEGSARWLAAELASGRINPEDGDEFRALLDGATATVPQTAAISFQRPDGTGYFYDAETKVLHEVMWPRKWQAQLNQPLNDNPVWPPANGVWVLRPSVLDGRPAGTFLVPARTPSGDVGVVGVRRDLAPLWQSLATNAEFRGYELVRFLLFNKRIVIGHPSLQTLDDLPWPAIQDLDDAYLKELNTGHRSRLNIVADIPGVETFTLETASGQRVFATKIDMERDSGGELMIGVHFDPRAGAAEFNSLLQIAGIGIALLIGSVLFAIFLGRRAALPMRRLANAAQLVQSHKLDAVEKLPVGSVTELATAASAFNEMVDGMKERETIRDLFGKYVPRDVASMLLADATTAQPRNAIATAFFLDVAGFSAMSEKLEASEVVATMNAFFSDAVSLIEVEGGMVTQFQGDAIVAVFNAPIERADHAIAALRAALAIVRTVAEREYAGQKLECRIGINTGPLVAGAIGARDRLSYTVYGDAVNVAARLEQMNKELGSQILLSAATADLVPGCAFKEMGCLSIRGREASVNVFTPVDSQVEGPCSKVNQDE